MSDEQDKTKQDPFMKVAVVYQQGMSSVAGEWGKAITAMNAVNADAGTYAQAIGGLTVCYMTDMAATMGLDRLKILKMFFNGMLMFLEKTQDFEACRDLAVQATQLLGVMNMAKVAREKGRMN